MLVWPYFKHNLIWRVSNGQTVKFWTNNWLTSIQSLGDLANVDLDGDEFNQKLVEYVTGEGVWD